MEFLELIAPLTLALAYAVALGAGAALLGSTLLAFQKRGPSLVWIIAAWLLTGATVWLALKGSSAIGAFKVNATSTAVVALFCLVRVVVQRGKRLAVQSTRVSERQGSHDPDVEDLKTTTT